jgi:acyl-homoserine lactone synthase
MLYFNKDGTVGACGRLNPSMRPHLLSEVFADMCEGGAPRSETIYEYSRYLVERKGKTQKEFMKAWMLITQAVNEYCIENGIMSVSWLARKRLYGLSTYLWKTRPLGLPKYYEDDQKEYIAAISVMDEDGLDRVRKYSKTFEPVANYHLPLRYAAQAKPLKIAS